MEYNNSLMLEELRHLKCTLYNHLWLFVSFSTINIIFFKIMSFFYKIYIALYLICTIIYILLIFVPIYPIILLYRKKLLFFRNILLLKKSSFFLIFISLFIGILINVIIILNILNFFNFLKECPYNFSYNDIASLFNINYNKYNITYNDYSNECKNKICILTKENLENEKFYSYLCNFDSSLDFDSFENQIARKIFSSKNIKQTENNYIKCNKFNYTEFENLKINLINKENVFIIKSFYDICSLGCHFYKCDRFEKPKEFKIDYDYSCPSIYDAIILLIFGFISIIFNLFCALIVFLFQFFIYKKILIIFLKINNAQLSTKMSINDNSKNDQFKDSNSKSNAIYSHTIIIEPNREIHNNNNNGNIISIRRVNVNNNSNQQDNNETTKSERKKIILCHINENNNYDNNSIDSIKFKQINLDENLDNINKIQKETHCLTESKNIKKQITKINMNHC